MQQSKRQRTDEQRGHAPEGPEQPRVGLAIVVRRVCQIAGKTPVRSFVTLATSLNHVVAAKPRGRVGRSENIVRAMAVVTLGDTLPTQARNLAVKGVEESFSLVFVTATALLHHLCAESQLFSARDRVRSMTVLAGGILFVRVRVVRPVDAGAERFFYPVVAGAAGAGDILRTDRRLRIRGRTLGVCAVTIGAGCRHDEAGLQGSTMDAVFIAAHDVVHFGVNPCRGLFADAMTISAKFGDVTRIGR